MKTSAFDYFEVTPKEVVNKITEFTDMELSEKHQGVATDTLLEEYLVSIPSWCRFFIHRGIIDSRRAVLNSPDVTTQLMLFKGEV